MLSRIHDYLTVLFLSFALALPVHGAWDFDGTDDCIESAENGITAVNGDQTVAMWVYVDNAPGSNEFVWVAATSWTGGAGVKKILYKAGATNMVFQFQHTTSGTSGIWETNTEFAYATWHHLVVTHDGTTADPIIYVNGVLRAITENQTPTGTADTGSDSWSWGCNRVGGASNFTDGALHGLAFFPRILNADEIASLHGGGRPRNLGGGNATHFMPLMEAPGSTVLVVDGETDISWTVSGSIAASTDFPNAFHYAANPVQVIHAADAAAGPSAALMRRRGR